MSDDIPLPAPRSRRDPAATRRKWVERIGRFRAAGQTVAVFCAAEGVSVPAFYQWKRVLTAEASPTDPPALVPIRLAPSTPAAIELVLGGAVLRFAAGTDPAVIAAFARQLGVAPR
jgi:transposase